MDMTPRTRLNPGSPWLRVAPEPASPSRDGPPSVLPRAPAPPAGRSERMPSEPIPGVEVSELEGDTVFDRLFGQLPPGPPPS